VISQSIVSPDEFEQLVEQALGELPRRFADLLDNVAVVVEEEPSAGDRRTLTAPQGELLGLYRGVPLTARRYDAPMLPDTISIFRGPILRVTRGRAAAIRQIRETVIHELGHYFGLSDRDMGHTGS